MYLNNLGANKTDYENLESFSLLKFVNKSMNA